MDTTIHINVADIPPEVGESFGRVTLAGFKNFIAQPGNREKLEAQTAARKARILMIVYGITAEQAAARAPAAQFAVTSVIAALFVWLDSMGMFDDVGRWMGRKLREVLDAVSD